MKEIEYLYRRNLIIIEFMLSKNSDDPILVQFKSVFQITYAKRNLTGLKTLSRDVNAWAKALTQTDINELEKQLEKQMGENLSSDKLTHLALVETLKKGEIEGEENYRIVYEYLQDIVSSDPLYNEVQRLQRMLQAYSK